ALAMLPAAMLAGGPLQASGVGWAVAGGSVGALGLIVFYQGLGAGPMTVVAPVSALVSTLLPVGVALAACERQGSAVYAGALVCLGAIVLISMEGQAAGQRPRPHRTARAIGYGAASGLAFGLYFLFLRNAGESGLLWPVAEARLAGTAVMTVAAFWQRARLGWRAGRPRVLLAARLSGGVHAGADPRHPAANLCYVAATRAGLFGVAVILTSLYPGITVLLARFIHGERMRPVQRLGLTLAAAGVALVTL